MTVSDIASFVPTLPTVTGEPDGWAIAGLPANFVVPAEQSVVTGQLLGRPAAVRFTPRSVRWDWGDGTTSTTAPGGGTWAQLGLSDFSATALSHVWQAKGAYTVHPVLVSTAEYSFDGEGWAPVVGNVVSPLTAVGVRVTVESTVLVADDCQANPGGVGC